MSADQYHVTISQAMGDLNTKLGSDNVNFERVMGEKEAECRMTMKYTSCVELHVALYASRL